MANRLFERGNEKEHRMLPSPDTIVIVKEFKAYVSYTLCTQCCRIHERTISLRFLGIILRVLRLEVYMTNQFQTTFAQGEGWAVGLKSFRRIE